MNDTESVKKTIRDLLRLAENDAATEGEIANALRFARRLMDRHHISEDEARRDPHIAAARDEAMDRSSTPSGQRNLTQWESHLTWFVCKLVGSVAHYFDFPKPLSRNNVLLTDAKGRLQYRTGLVFFGPAEDVSLAVQIFEDLHATIIAMARLRFGAVFRGEGRSYAEGFVRGLQTKLNEATTADEARSPETRALMARATHIAAEKQQRANDWLRKECGIRITTTRTHGGGEHFGDAYGAGREDGTRAKLNATRRNKLTSNPQLRLT